jgi:hypothetical protein
MKIIWASFLFFATLASGACAKDDTTTQTKEELPPEILDLISTTEKINSEKIHILSKSIFTWKQGYIFGVEIDDKPKICLIYTFVNNKLEAPFSYAPCDFYGPPATNLRQGETNPDLIYKTNIVSPIHGVGVNHLVAFAFDENKETYCESKSLALWYQSGNQKKPAHLNDFICPGK